MSERATRIYNAAVARARLDHDTMAKQFDAASSMDRERQYIIIAIETLLKEIEACRV